MMKGYLYLKTFTVFSSFRLIIAHPIERNEEVIDEINDNIENAADGEQYIDNIFYKEENSERPGLLMFTAPYKLCEGGCKGSDEGNIALQFPVFIGGKGREAYKRIYNRDMRILYSTDASGPFKKRTSKVTTTTTQCVMLKLMDTTTTTTTTEEPTTTTTTTTEEPTTTTTTTEEPTTTTTTTTTTEEPTTTTTTTTEEPTTTTTTTEEPTTTTTTTEEPTTTTTTTEEPTTTTTTTTTTTEKPTTALFIPSTSTHPPYIRPHFQPSVSTQPPHFQPAGRCPTYPVCLKKKKILRDRPEFIPEQINIVTTPYMVESQFNFDDLDETTLGDIFSDYNFFDFGNPQKH